MYTYGLGSLGNNMIYAFISTYLLKFYTDSFGIAAASVGVLFLIARIWDAINDPIMGIIVDNTHTKMGKFRPYLLFVPLLMTVTTVLCFSKPDLAPTWKLVYAYVTYIAWGMSFTAMDIPYWSMSAVLTQDVQQRNRLVMISRTFASVGFLIVNVLTLPLVDLMGSWAAVAVLYGVSCIVFTLITFKFSEEKVHVSRTEKQTLSKVVTLFKANEPLRRLIYSMLIIETINAIRFSFTLYYLEYNLNAEELIPVMLGLYLLFTVLGSVVSPFISHRIGKKNTAIYASILMSITASGMYFTGYGNIIPIFIWNSFNAFAMGAMMIAQQSMVVDCVEYGEYKTGNRAEGMVFSTNIFKTKLATAFGGAIGAFGLSYIGYVPNVQQAVSTLDAMHKIFTIIPGVLSLLAILPLIRYTLTEENYKKMLEAMKGIS
ncbi:MAG: MFS transporter [Clostridia bacterium]|nr:MFS transporter [Clostridia bacterium]